MKVFVAGVTDALGRLSIRPVEVNGHPGVVGLDGRQRIIFALSLDIADNQIRA